MKKKIMLVAIIAAVLCLVAGGSVLAMSSVNYNLSWGLFSSGGGERESSAYSLGDTAGQSISTGSSSSTSYRLGSGYWYGVTGNIPVSIPSISIEKYTNGVDADTAPGPMITIGDSVTWEYMVTNTGSFELNNVTVTDDQGVTVNHPKNTLATGESMTCTASGTAIAGQYTNLGTVTADPPDGLDAVSDSDPSHYYGIEAAYPGDANGDGVINVLDITKVVRIVLQLDTETPGADANSDGTVNVLDITKIVRIILQLDPQ